MAKKFSPNDANIYKILCDLAKAAKPFPGYVELAKKAGWKSSASAVDSVGRLEAAGMLKRQKQGHYMTGIHIPSLNATLPAPQSATLAMRTTKAAKVKRAKKTAPTQKRIPHKPGIVPKELETPATAIAFEQLQHWSCRYPFGDKDYVYCGKKRMENSSYCREHHAYCHRSGGGHIIDDAPASPAAEVLTIEDMPEEEKAA